MILVGATTENPSFAVNAALLSRVRVFKLEPIGDEDVRALLVRALADRDRGLGTLGVTPAADALDAISEHAHGDARRALDVLELSARDAASRNVPLDRALVSRALASPTLRYDKSGEEHYNVVSAFIKSMRGSEPDAAIYWMMRMLEAGEEPLFVMRRMLIFASEDVGNADPRALMLAVAAKDAVHFTGMPEGFYPLAQATTYLATAPKSNASGEAYKAAKEDVLRLPDQPVPLHLRNAATGLMKDLGYGKGYEYAHDKPGGVVSHGHRPPALENRVYYRPADRGYEITIQKLMEERRKRS